MTIRAPRGLARRVLTLLTLAAVPLMLLGVFAAMEANFADVRALRQATDRTIANRDRLSEVLMLHLDAETAARGYVLTGDEHFLGPYDSALARRDAVFAAVRDPHLLQGLERLRPLSIRKFENARLNIADVREGRASQARARIIGGTGREVMDAIRAEIARLDAEEVARLEALTRQSTASRGRIQSFVTALLAGIALVLIMVTLFVNRSMRMRNEALENAQMMHEREMTMFDGAVDGMLLLDEDGNILRMNPSVSRMFGYDEDALVGRHNMFLMDSAYTLAESQAWLATVGAASAHGAGRRQEFTGRRRDGSTFDTEVAISRVASSAGHRYVAAIRDISDRKRADAMKTEFVSTVSHELRTPLTSIGGSLALLGAGAVGPLEDKQKRLVEIARSNCERLIRLINDILDIEKIESGKMEFDLRRMQVAPLVERTVAAMRGFAQQHGVRLVTVLPPWPQCVTGDPDKLEQLLTNLISNAVKHAPEGSEVEIFSSHEGGKVRLEVRDRGAGVPHDFRARIFGKFAMADASDSRGKGGTGLGLAIAREIARRHGGEVGFDDRDGGGTVFHFDLPSASSDPAVAPAPADPALPTILHIDDDQDTLSVVASAFAGRAHIVPAHTLAEGRTLLQRTRPDAAIVDVGLAYEKGLDLVPDLRSAVPGLPIVVFTAVDEALTGAESVDRVLVKSRSSIADLVAVTMRLLDHRQKAA